MDLNMPIFNGLETTKALRKFSFEKVIDLE